MPRQDKLFLLAVFLGCSVALSLFTSNYCYSMDIRVVIFLVAGQSDGGDGETGRKITGALYCGYSSISTVGACT